MSPAAYQRESLLGTGGMAEVWRARSADGHVALKCLLPHAARNPSLAAAFEREGRLLQRIHHPHVVAIRDIVRDAGGPVLVLEYVEGVDLRAMVRVPAPPALVLTVIRDVLRALEAVHGLCDEQGRRVGLIHRDLSPSNVLVGVDGAVKLTDFGIARALVGSHATTGLQIKGTLAYLSPEQASGAPLDHRSDLFAVGAILYELLAGVAIYDDADPRVLLARARAADIRSLGERRPDLAPTLAEFVDRSLSARPGDRFPSAAAMGSELDRIALASVGGFVPRTAIAQWSQAAYRQQQATALVEPISNHEVPRPANLPSHRPRWLPRARSRCEALIAALPPWARWGVMPTAGGVFAVLLVWWAARFSAAPARAPVAAPAELAAPTASIALVAPTASIALVASIESTPASAAPSIPSEAPAASAPAAVPTAPSDFARAPVAFRRTMPTPPPNGMPVRRALLDLGSEPGFAYVSIDGVRIGATPLFGYALPPGTHRIEVSREGLGSKSLVLEAHPGERIRRIIKFP